jgi:two-component system, NarL family, invasion response regulator UvrY
MSGNNNMIHVAIADEYAIYREGLAATIDMFTGFKVIIKAEGGDELLDSLERAQRLPDLCVFDISLPVLNGYETLKEIKKRWPHIKVLILSMFGNELNVIRTIKVGANGFLLKGADDKDLEKALCAIHEKGYYYSDLLPERYLTSVSDSPLLKLSYREMEFLSQCCTELSYKAIGQAMGISINTVDSYRKSLAEKLGINSRIGLVLFALNMGIMPVR